jgi:hypothetical protein
MVPKNGPPKNPKVYRGFKSNKVKKPTPPQVGILIPKTFSKIKKSKTKHKKGFPKIGTKKI